MRRVPEHEQRRHKITVNLTDQEYDALIERATASQLAPSVVARTVFSEGLARMRGKRRASASDSVPTPVREQQQKPRQPEHDALCLPYLREASGPTDAIRRLEAGRHPVAVWPEPVAQGGRMAYLQATRYLVSVPNRMTLLRRRAVMSPSFDLS